jgi:hypothetical protein
MLAKMPRASIPAFYVYSAVGKNPALYALCVLNLGISWISELRGLEHRTEA